VIKSDITIEHKTDMWQVKLNEWTGGTIKQAKPLEVLVEFNQPLTFTFKDESGALLLAHIISQDDQFSRYVVVPTTDQVVSQLKSRVLSIIAALDQPFIWLIDLAADFKVAKVWAGTLKEMPHVVLPASDVMLYAKEITPYQNPLDVAARIDELRLLRAGWINGGGKAFDTKELDRLISAFTTHYPEDLPLPYIFPTESGGIQFEWRLETSAPEIEIDLNTLRGEWLSKDKATIELSTPEGWIDLANRISALVKSNKNGGNA